MAGIVIFPTPICVVCGKNGEIEIPIEKLSEVTRWRLQKHKHIQDILPEISADHREMLISGTHPECWKELFGDEQ
jgi:hypothetical protein